MVSGCRGGEGSGTIIIIQPLSARGLKTVLLILLLSSPGRFDKQTTPRNSDEILKALNASSVTVPLATTVVDKKYGPWSRWSTCSRKCKQVRTRVCRTGEQCDRDVIRERKNCLDPGGLCTLETFTQQLSDRGGVRDVIYDLLYYDWTEWSECQIRTCKRKRYRTCAMKKWCQNTVLLEEKVCSIADNDVCPKKTGGRGMRKKQKSSAAFSYDPTSCGLRNRTASLRIVGGHEAQRGSWPWVVAIMTRWKEQYCGGALIAPQWVLTAAHCVRKNGRRRRLIVRVGEHNLSYSEGSELDVKIAADYAHHDFDIDTIDSDIALIKLRTPVDPGPYVSFACLPQAKDVLAPNTLCYAVGWGKVRDIHIFGTDVLREARVPLIEDRECRQAFDYQITANQMCAGFRRGGVDTCAGDSGGPLMCSITDGNGVLRWNVYGVTSFGEGCGDRGKYGIYTRVTNFSNWIRETMRKYQ